MRKGRTGSFPQRALCLALILILEASAQTPQPPAGGAPPATSEGKPAKGKREKPKNTKPGPAIISGTVFRDPGLSFPGVEVTLEPQPEGKASKKVGKKMKTISDGRGEFSFRVASVPMRYTVSVQAAGHQPEKSQVFINGEERQDVFFTLKPLPAPAPNAPRE